MILCRNSWTYEEAKEFFKEASKEDEWSWEKDTTLKDIQENPLAFVAILGGFHFSLLLILNSRNWICNIFPNVI